MRKVVLEEPPGNLSMIDPKVIAARKKLFGAWEMNWLAYNDAHDLKLANSSGREIPFLMYPQGEANGERFDSLDPDAFRYRVDDAEGFQCPLGSHIRRGNPRDTLGFDVASGVAQSKRHRLIRRARLATDSARSVALIDVYGRLVRLLNELARSPNEAGERPLKERLTHQQMAQHLACSREMVSRLLKDLETGGYIAVRERWIVLRKPLPARW